ncbi:TPA: hypothetical protein SMR47_000119 [Pseudomonas putida]|nr:hypothetical protein [Pseudomonas putida]
MDFNTLFRLLLTFNATSLLVIVYLVQHEITFGGLIEVPSLPGLISGLSYALYLAVPIVLTGLSLRLSSRLGRDTFQPGQVVSIEHANNSFLPSYLGYFFVALSINSFQTLVFVYSILFIFTYRSQALYFNPLFLLYGYEFYNVSTSSHVTLFLISKESFRTPKDVVIDKVYCINDYTLIDRG